MLFLALYFNDLAKKANSNVVFADAIVVATFDGYFDVVLTQFGFEKRIHADNLPLNSHQFSGSTDSLTLFWQKGVSTTALNREFTYLEDDDGEIELDEDAIAEEMQKDVSSEDGEDHTSDKSNHKTSTNGTAEVEVKALSITQQAEDTNNAPENNVVAYKRLSKRNSGAIIPMSATNSSSGSQTPISVPSYDGLQCSQTLKPLDSIKVAIHVEMTQTPPLLRVLAANPFM